MEKAQDLVEKLLIPYLEEHHPNAKLVLLSGSFGRAMQGGDITPINSSDLDVFIVYDNVEDGGLKAATRQYDYVDVSDYLGGPSREIMLDLNVHDLESLKHQEGFLKHVWRCPFAFNMIVDGHVLKDEGNKYARKLKKAAEKAVEEGPSPLTHQEGLERLQEMRELEYALDHTRKIDDLKLAGVLGLRSAGNLLLALNEKWSSGTNQVNRYLQKYTPSFKGFFDSAFEKLIEDGDPSQARALVGYLRETLEEKLPTLPPSTGFEYPSPDDINNLPAEERQDIENRFERFALNHFCEALDSAEKRGKDNYLDNLSATLGFMLKTVQRSTGKSTTGVSEGLDLMESQYPGIRKAFHTALEYHKHAGIQGIADKMLEDRGGLEYKFLQVDFPEDIARRNAMDITRPKSANDDKPGASQARKKRKAASHKPK